MFLRKKAVAPSGNRTRLPCLVGTDSTTKPKVLIENILIFVLFQFQINKKINFLIKIKIKLIFMKYIFQILIRKFYLIFLYNKRQ